jgi:hypothetical protein
MGRSNREGILKGQEKNTLIGITGRKKPNSRGRHITLLMTGKYNAPGNVVPPLVVNCQSGFRYPYTLIVKWPLNRPPSSKGTSVRVQITSALTSVALPRSNITAAARTATKPDPCFAAEYFTAKSPQKKKG